MNMKATIQLTYLWSYDSQHFCPMAKFHEYISKRASMRRKSSQQKSKVPKKSSETSKTSVDSGQGSCVNSDAFSLGTTDNSSEFSCPFCEEDYEHSVLHHECQNRMLYCSKGSLCSRRSKATVKSRKVPGKRKKRKKVVVLIEQEHKQRPSIAFGKTQGCHVMSQLTHLLFLERW